jgi:hypothetical protein
MAILKSDPTDLNSAFRDAVGATPAENIDEVIDRLTRIIDAATSVQSRLGYFAVLYRSMTVAVRAGIRNGRFKDPQLMDRLDVTFANRYFSALWAHVADEETPRSWHLAFEATSSPRPTIIQHLLLGVNAHINYDLGLAAAATVPSESLPILRPDFEEINSVIATVHQEVQRKIDAVSPFQRLIDLVGARTENVIIEFSMDVAREAAWGAACTAALSHADPSFTAELDGGTARLGQLILNPGRVTSLALRLIGLAERRSVPAVITALS